MDNTTPPQFPPAFPPVPPIPPAPRKRKTARVALTALGAAAVLGLGIVIGASGGTDQQHDDSVSGSSPRPVLPAVKPSPTPSYVTLDKSSFEIKLITKERQCFGSAGCNVTVEPDLTLTSDPEDIDPDAMYEITYEVHGDESGTVIETAELTNRTSLSVSQTSISTASSSTKVTAEITAVTQD